MRCKLLGAALAFLAFVLVGVLVAAVIGDVNMASGYPDWMDVVALIGQDPDGNLILIQVDADGQLTVPFKGENPTGDLVTIAVDADGQLYAIMRGAAGEDLLVDSDGFLTTVMKGLEGANLRTIAVDASGNLIAVMKGLEGSNLRTIAVDASGRIIMVPYGTTTVQGTATVTQDDSVREIQGADGATLRTIVVDSSGQMIMVPKGQSGYYMAIDADGFMTAILKGIHNSTLTTIALDAEGRIYGYQVDDLDQWGQTLLVGNAEQAARLGSPISWDRRGQVQLLNDFRHGMGGYVVSGDGTGYGVALDPSYHQSGGYSVKLTGGSSGANRNAGFTGHLGLPPSDTVGFALRWSGVATPDYLRLQLTIYKGGTAYFGYLRYDFDNERLQYMDSLGVYQNLAVQEIVVQPYAFNSLKLVIDADASTYVRALLNDTEYDLSAYALLTSASGVKGEVAFSPMVYGHAGDNDIVYIDYICITVEE